MPTQPVVGELSNQVWGDDWPEVRALWSLESTVSHLNHGGFGAVPTPVLEEQDSWRLRQETNPVRFFTREMPGAVEQARGEVAHFLGSDPDGLVFVRNSRMAASTVLSQLELEPDDEILLTDHAYGTVAIGARRWAERVGVRVVIAAVPLTANDADAAAAVLDSVSARTRVAFLDHVTSGTARRLPLVDLVPALQERGVPVFVDGAHAPGMLAVDLDRLGADWWSGSLHKWCCTPRGTGVLYASPARRKRLRPLVASWTESRGFPAAFDMTGTDDVTSWLSAPRAIRFLQQLDLDRLRRHNVELAVHGQRVVAEALGLDPAGLPRDPAVSMQLVPLPPGVAADDDAAASLQASIGEQVGVETAITSWHGRGFLRLSAQAYNAPGEYARFAAELPTLL